MATASAGIAEVYVMKKLHKEKMKRMESTDRKAERKVYMIDPPQEEMNSSFGCFSSMFKKIHPANNIPAALDSAEEQARPQNNNNS